MRRARTAAQVAERAALQRVERSQIALDKARRAVREATSSLENAAVKHASECARWERAKSKTDEFGGK